MRINSFYAGDLQLGEGIYYDQQHHHVWWVDIVGKRVFRANADGSDLRSWTTPELVGFVLPHPTAGHYWLGLQSGPHIARFDRSDSPSLQRFATVDGTPDHIRLNDGSLSPDGQQLYVTTMDMAIKNPVGRLMRFDLAGHVTDLAHNFIVTNGPAVAPDELTLFVAESEGHDGRPKGIYRIDLRADVPTETLLVDWPYEGSPDGLSIEPSGTFWAGNYGGHTIRQFDQAGKLLRSIELPALNVTKVAHIDNRLFVTSALEGTSDEQRRQYPLTGHVLVVEDVD